MNIKEFYRITKQDLEEKTKEFNFTKKQIKKMIENGKKNGEEINKICDDILTTVYDWNSGRNNFYDFGYLESKILEIKNIVGGKDE